MTVTFADGRTADGTVAGLDIDGDLAVISVDTGEVPALPWADDAAAEIGTPVFALANPAGRGLRVTFGFVSGVERTFRGPRAMQVHDAAAAPGALQRRGSPGAACVVRCAVHGEDRPCR